MKTLDMIFQFCCAISVQNKLAKARKTCKSLGTLGLRKFGQAKLRIEKVWAQNISIIFLTELVDFMKINSGLKKFKVGKKLGKSWEKVEKLSLKKVLKKVRKKVEDHGGYMRIMAVI